MNRRPPRSTPFPYTPLFLSPFTGIPFERPSTQYATLTFSSDPNLPLSATLSGQLLRTVPNDPVPGEDRKSTRLNSSHANTSYAVFCLKKNNETLALHPSLER